MTGHGLFSSAWAKAYADALNANEAYADAGSNWEGSIALKVRADPDAGIAEDRAVVLDLWHGECRKTSVVTGGGVEEAAEYVIEASLSTWLDVLEGEMRPLKALMFGKLKLEKGKLRDLAPYARAAQQMVKSAQEVPVQR
jgi:putative sterol carrier protein